MLLAEDAMRSDFPDLEPPAAAAAASPNPNLETAAQPAAAANMDHITGRFADPSHEAAFAAQLFRMAYPAHVLLMALVLTCSIWNALVEPDIRAFWIVSGCGLGLGLLCRVLLHRTGKHDPMRSQWMGSWAWIVLAALIIASDVVNIMMARAAACKSFLQQQYMVPFAYLTCVLVNGTHGLGFACKFALIAMALIDCVSIAACRDPELGPWIVCTMGVIVLGSAATHTAELFLRRSYAEKVLAKIQLEERNGQLQAEKERLLYDMQRRGRPLDDDDDRSAIGRGFLAGSSQLFNYGDTDPSEPGGAPSDTPPTLPPGPPSSASSASGQKQLAAEALADMAMDAGAAQQSIRMVLGANQPGVKAEWLTEMCNELDEGHNDGGAGSEPQEPHLVPVGPPGSLDPDQGSMTPRQRALHVARQRLRFARTMIESYQVVQTLALALGASRVEGGTIKALHAVLLRIDRPGMSEQEACTSTGASLSSFQKWGRRVQHARLDLPPPL
jgi:hypothetical protein